MFWICLSRFVSSTCCSRAFQANETMMCGSLAWILATSYAAEDTLFILEPCKMCEQMKTGCSVTQDTRLKDIGLTQCQIIIIKSFFSLVKSVQ